MHTFREGSPDHARRLRSGETASSNAPDTAVQRFVEGASHGADAASAIRVQRLVGNQGTTRVLQRLGSNVALSPQGKEFFATKMKNPLSRTLKDNVPSTGMGKFDAEFVPERQQLMVTVRLAFTYKGTWTDPEKAQFEGRFVQQVERDWSGQYTFQCTKAGWTEYVATPVVHVRKVPESDAHYNIAVDAQPGRAMVGREGSRAGQTSGAMFFKDDVNPAPHQSSTIRCNIATHEADRLMRILRASPYRTVFFRRDDASVDDLAPLVTLAKALVAQKLPGAPKVPLTATGYAEKGETKGLDQRRADAVASALEAILVDYDVRAVKRSDVAAAAVAAAKAKTKANRPSTRAEGKRELKSAKEAAKPLTGGDGCKVEIGIDEGFAMTFAGDPYSVAVHEFGHMLGNPDEYFNFGAETLDMKIRQLVDSGDPERVKEAANLSGRKNMPLLSGNDRERADIQRNYAALVKSAGLEIPMFGSQNSSLMSAGTDLLPRHYVALWEALGRITDPTISQNEWAIR